MEKLPQILMIALTLFSLLMGANKHGKIPKSEPYSFWTSLIAVAIQSALLIWGGFFNNLFH